MKQESGFSLIEILIVISLISIITTITITSQKYLFQSSTTKTAAAQLLHAIQIARNQAIIKNKPVILCKTGEWQNGYIIKMQSKKLYIFSNSIPDGIIHWRAFPSHREDLEFLPTGYSRIENGTFWLCFKSKKSPAWAIMLNQAGRARMIYPDQKGNIYDGKQMLIQC